MRERSNSDHLWIDHVRLTDSRYRDSEAPLGPNGKAADLNAVARASFEQNRAEELAEAELSGAAAPDWTGWEFTTDVGWDPADAYS